MNVLETNSGVSLNLNKAISYYRRSLNMSQRDLARILGVQYPTICCWETGKNKPSIDNLVNMAKVLGVSEMELLHPTENVINETKIGKVKTNRRKVLEKTEQ